MAVFLEKRIRCKWQTYTRMQTRLLINAHIVSYFDTFHIDSSENKHTKLLCEAVVERYKIK